MKLILLTIMFYSSLYAIPTSGYIPNKETAIQVAIAILSPIYGVEHIKKNTPFKAVLKNNIWIVTGSLPKIMPGGVPIIKINKMTAEIISVSHGK